MFIKLKFNTDNIYINYTVKSFKQYELSLYAKLLSEISIMLNTVIKCSQYIKHPYFGRYFSRSRFQMTAFGPLYREYQSVDSKTSLWQYLPLICSVVFSNRKNAPPWLVRTTDSAGLSFLFYTGTIFTVKVMITENIVIYVREFRFIMPKLYCKSSVMCSQPEKADLKL